MTKKFSFLKLHYQNIQIPICEHYILSSNKMKMQLLISEQKVSYKRVIKKKSSILKNGYEYLNMQRISVLSPTFVPFLNI